MDLTVVIPSKGRPSLAETLDSIPALDWVEVVVVADGEDALTQILPIADGARVFEVLSRTWGHRQRNLGMEKAEGDWLCFMDDDDVYLPGAFDAFRQVSKKVPHLFRMRYSYDDLVLWDEPVLASGNVSSQMILTPNIPSKLGVWPDERCGDYDFIRDTIALHGTCEWVDTVVCELRDGDRHYH